MEASALAAWTRRFAAITLLIHPNPPVEAVGQAISTYLPHQQAQLSATSAEDLLENVLGIAVIVDYGREKIGWTTTTNPVEAEELRQLYCSEAYSKVRHELGINGMWIFLADPNFLDHYHDEDLYEKAPDPIEVYEAYPEAFRLEDREECVVVKL